MKVGPLYLREPCRLERDMVLDEVPRCASVMCSNPLLPGISWTFDPKKQVIHVDDMTSAGWNIRRASRN